MKISALLSAASVISVAATLVSTAHAATIYSNPYDPVADVGNCEWSTTCAADRLTGDDFAAQAFSLASTEALTSATFTELDFGTSSSPTAVNWAIYDANGAGGLPGTLVSSGSSPVTSATSSGEDASKTYSVTTGTFGLSSVDLTGGTYYLALQGVSSTFNNYLAQGLATSGAAETTDGGVTFKSGYEGQTSVAVSISGAPVSAAPEPGTWALMFAGLGLVGGALRMSRRKDALTLA